MTKKIIILSGSPIKEGNTTALVGWFAEGAKSQGAQVEIIPVASLKFKVSGCTACRACQKLEKYECVINDDAKPVLAKMAEADAIVMATPLYFYGPSAQLKVIFDRMFSLYKWNNEANTMKTPLKGKRFVLLASAFEDIGLDVLEQPFKLTADYTGMPFESFCVPNAGVSGGIKNKEQGQQQATVFGQKVAAACSTK